MPGILYVPRHETPEGFVLYLHGGGYIGTSPNMYAFFTAQVCRQTGCAVFVADYRLAPEFPYPAGAEDASAIYAELIGSGIPHERIFLAGDSGGGGLANTVLLEDPERIRPVRPAGLLLFSPEVDLRLDEPSVTENADHDILPWNIPTAAYLHGADVTSSPVSPLTADLSGFPPTCVTWGGDEMFRDPIRRYVERLRAAGVPTYGQEFDGMFHVFEILMPWAVNSREVFAARPPLHRASPGGSAAPRRPRPGSARSVWTADQARPSPSATLRRSWRKSGCAMSARRCARSRTVRPVSSAAPYSVMTTPV